MSSQSQINANRQNAKLSTGPRTPAGKAESSHNAFRHGLTSKNLIIAPDEKEIFAEFERGHLRDHMPIGATQWTLFDQIIRTGWNLLRLDRLEREHMDRLGIDPILCENDTVIDRIERYRRNYSNQLNKALEQLRKLQTERAIRTLPENTGMLAYPALVDGPKLLHALTKRSQNNLPEFKIPPLKEVQNAL